VLSTFTFVEIDSIELVGIDELEITYGTNIWKKRFPGFAMKILATYQAYEKELKPKS